MSTGPDPRPNFYGNRLIDQAAALPFDLGSSDILADTTRAAEGLRDKLKSTFGWTDAQAYAHLGISGMNGMSDQQEMTSLDTRRQITAWAKGNGLARLGVHPHHRRLLVVEHTEGGGLVCGPPPLSVLQ